MILTVRDLTVSFDGFIAVDGLDVAVEEDELRCVIGPNGAGKTTLLDMICGKTRPSRGSIRFKDHELTEMIEYEVTRLGVGRKFQTPSTYEDLTVLENLEISHPRKRGVVGSLFVRRDRSVQDKIEEVATRIDLADQLQVKAGQGRAPLARAEAVARDRHAADAGLRPAPPGRAGGRHEPA